MAFTDRNTVPAAAVEIRGIMDAAATMAGVCTQRMRALTTTYTRAALSAEFGADAAAMLNLYNQLENFRAGVRGDAAVPLP